jgi:DNA-binding transcriptional LysR family regulator
VRGALALVDEASTTASEMGEEPRGTVRLTAPPALVSSLIPALAEFLQRYPKIYVELSGSQGVVDLVEQGLDLVVRIGRLRDSSLIAKRVGKLVTGLFASRDYVERRGRPRKLSELAKHNCVLFRSHGNTDTWHLFDDQREHRIDVSGSLEVDEIPSLHQAVLAGLGIGSISLYSSSRMNGLTRILPAFVSGELPISLVSPSKRLEPARVVLLRDFLAARLSFQPKRN